MAAKQKKAKKPRISYLPYLLPQWKWFILGPLGIAGGAVLEIIEPRLMAKIVNAVDSVGGIELTQAIKDGVMNTIITNGLWMVGLAILAIACSVMGVCCIAIGTFRFGEALRAALYHKVQGYSFANIDKFSTGSLVTRLTNDVTNVQNTYVETLRMATFTTTMLTGSLINALAINARLAIVTFCAVPLVGLAIFIVIRKGFPLFQKMQKSIDALNVRVQESVTNIRVIKSFVREDHERERFRLTADNLCKIAITANVLVVTVMPLMQLILNLTTVVSLWFGGGMVAGGEMQIGDLMSYSTYIMHILMSLMMFSMTLMMFSRAGASSTRMKEVLCEQSTITDKPDAVTEPVKNGSITFSGVDFRYSPTAPDKALDSVDFTVTAGEVVAIVGATGSAKSTLVNLIPRLYDVSDGQILVDGVDVRDYQIETLRESIGMVPQKNILFSGTVAENIRWGKPDATDEEVMAAAQAAQAHEFITALPDGYQTRLDQGGVNVSGGQKQRLCIARAMIKKPPILILDDSTSAVDSDTESRIRQAFSQQLHGTTVLLIAQRISSVRTADRILVMDGGKIAGFGTHDELLASNEIYQEIVSSQEKGGVA